MLATQAVKNENPGAFPPNSEPIDYRNAVRRYDVPEEFEHERFAQIHSGFYNIAALIYAGGRYYLAAEIVRNAIPGLGRGRWHPYQGEVLRYGPGARRYYYEVNEGLVNGIAKAGEGILNISYRKADHLAPRARKVQDFAVALIDYITD